MVTSLLFALVMHSREFANALISGEMEWEETAVVQKIHGYHPMLRYNPGSTFIFVTPDYIAQGHYQQQGGHYDFRPETAIELNHADVDKLTADLNPEARQSVQQAYARSLAPFEADYTPSSGVLNLNYPVKGRWQSFELHSYTEGDDQLVAPASGDDRGLVGLWCSPDPFPERLDSKTRFRIEGLEGLERFSKEASASDAAQFGLLDLRVDHSFRLHAKVGTWQKRGSTVHLLADGAETVLTISRDARQLVAGGKPAYIRG